MDEFCEDAAVIVVLSGCAKGADRLGERWAEARGYRLEKFPADWSKHGKAAGMIRNSEMIKQADALVAFWNGRSRGTEDSVDKARKVGLKVKVVRYGN